MVCKLFRTAIVFLLVRHGITMNIQEKLHIDVQCTESSVRATWSKPKLTGRITVTLNDPQCNDFTGTNNTHVWIETEFTRCRFSTSQHEDVVVFENTARIVVSTWREQKVAREGYFEFEIGCFVARSLGRSSRYSNAGVVRNKEMVTVQSTDVSEEHFNVSIDLYTNKHFVEKSFLPVTVSLGEPVYVNIEEQTGSLKYKFVVHTCFLIPQSTGGESMSVFPIMYQNCVLDQQEMTIISNDQQYFRFFISTGRSIALAANVYIHCRLYVCAPESKAPGCQQTCGDEVNVQNIHPNDEPPLKEISLSTPLLHFKRKVTCSELQCTPHSKCYELFPARCRCVDGYIMHTLSRLCERIVEPITGVRRIATIDNIVIAKKFIPEYADPTSLEFHKLAQDTEDQFSYYIRLYNESSIIGIKLVAARPGSVILQIELLPNYNVSSQKAFDTFIGAVIDKREENVNSDMNVTNSTKPQFLGLSIQIVGNKIPTLVDDTIGTPENPTDSVILVSILIPSLCVLVLCFLLFVHAVQKRTKDHYYFEEKDTNCDT